MKKWTVVLSQNNLLITKIFNNYQEAVSWIMDKQAESVRKNWDFFLTTLT